MGFLPAFCWTQKTGQKEVLNAERNSQHWKQVLQTEDDYSYIEGLYSVAKLSQQAKLISDLKKRNIRMVNGPWCNEVINFMPNGIACKNRNCFNEIVQRQRRILPGKVRVKNALHPIMPAYWAVILMQKTGTGLKKRHCSLACRFFPIGFVNNMVWNMQETDSNLVLAEEFSRFAVERA